MKSIRKTEKESVWMKLLDDDDDDDGYYYHDEDYYYYYYYYYYDDDELDDDVCFNGPDCPGFLLYNLLFFWGLQTSRHGDVKLLLRSV